MPYLSISSVNNILIEADSIVGLRGFAGVLSSARHGVSNESSVEDKRARNCSFFLSRRMDFNVKEAKLLYWHGSNNTVYHFRPWKRPRPEERTIEIRWLRIHESFSRQNEVTSAGTYRGLVEFVRRHALSENLDRAMSVARDIHRRCGESDRVDVGK